MVFPPNQENGAVRLPHLQITEPAGSLTRKAAQTTVPLHGATPTDALRRQASLCRSLRAAQPRQRDAVQTDRGRPARREARAPAGQLKNAAPSRSAAGKSATANLPAHRPACRAALPLAPAIVTKWPRRRRWLGGVNPRRRVCGIERGAGLPLAISTTFIKREFKKRRFDSGSNADTSVSLGIASNT